MSHLHPVQQEPTPQRRRSDAPAPMSDFPGIDEALLGDLGTSPMAATAADLVALGAAQARRNTAQQVTLYSPGYEALAGVLRKAFDQAAHGKGAERHANALPFDAQPMQQLIRLYGVGFALGQAAKKAQESQRMPERARQVAELLGAIVYLAGAVIALEAQPVGGAA